MGDYIMEFWEGQARRHGTSHSASWGDTYAVRLEIETIGQHIHQGDHVLDVGCANGYATFHHLERKVHSLVGVDFSRNMIEQANVAKQDVQANGEISFEVGDVRDLRFKDDVFDVVYTTRVLINLPTWQEQMQGIRECCRVCKSGGTVILSEAFWEPLALLNALRALTALPPLVEHDFNRYLKKRYLEEFLNSHHLDFESIDFSSVYYLGSRFLRELVTDPNAYPGYTNPINELFYNIERDYSGGGFGIQQAYVIRA